MNSAKSAALVPKTGINIEKSYSYAPSRAMRAALRLLRGIEYGRLQIVFPDGRNKILHGYREGPQAVLIIHHDRAARRFITGGKLGFCESYLDGDWSSPDMTAFFTLMLVNAQALELQLQGSTLLRWGARLYHMMRPNTRRGARQNIYEHYDLGNAFYKLWLDGSMTYSAGLYHGRELSLAAAQNAKYATILEKLAPRTNDHILEIGCGWGGFAEYAARHSDCRITAITISQAQFDYARQRIKNAGFSDRVDIKLMDYRDLTGQYDHIVPIEMFEAVGEKFWPGYFDTLNRVLRTGGHAVLQIITIRDRDFDNYRRNPDYIQRHVFPGGMLPSLGVLNKMVAARTNMHVTDINHFGKDYGTTLDEWHKNFIAAWPRISQMKGFDIRFRRLWEQYLCYCAAGFKAGTIDVIHMRIKKDN